MLPRSSYPTDYSRPYEVRPRTYCPPPITVYPGRSPWTVLRVSMELLGVAMGVSLVVILLVALVACLHGVQS